MADKNQQPQTAQAKGGNEPKQNAEKLPSKPSEPTEGGRTTETVRNLALIMGITILMIMAVILVAFFIAGIAGNKPNPAQTTGTISQNVNGNNGTQGSTTGTTPAAKTQDSVVGSLGGGAQDSKQGTSGNQVPTPSQPVAQAQQPAPAVIAAAVVSPTLPSAYTFTAKKGDSVTWLARRAMYAYLGDHHGALDAAQRLFFETTLAHQNSPAPLRVGETRTFSASAMDTIMSQAVNLSSGQHSAWNHLVVQSGYR